MAVAKESRVFILNKYMKDKYIFGAYATLLLIAVFGIVFFFSQKDIRPAETAPPHTRAEIAQTMIEIGQVSPADSLFPPQQVNPIDISIKGADTSTVELSWDDSQADVFRIVLLDKEWLQSKFEESLIWAIVSLKSIPNDGSAVDLTRENMVGFISSGYIIGEEIPGFIHEPGPASSLLEGASLLPGREYALLLNGFKTEGAEDEQIFMSTTFTFTDSCLPPNCE